MDILGDFRKRLSRRRKSLDLALHDQHGTRDEARRGFSLGVPSSDSSENEETNIPQLPPLRALVVWTDSDVVTMVTQAANNWDALQNPYEYIPLNHPKDLRVVRIQPGSEPLACTIETVNFDRMRVFGTYEAVSYVWGPLDSSIDLLVNGDSHLKISARLHTILKRLSIFYSGTYSRTEGRLPIWVDALCIDQHNDAERSSQVQQMAEIYRRANKVHVFLTDNPHSTKWYDSDWWTRRWVIQEVLAARQVLVHHFPANSLERSWDITWTSWRDFFIHIEQQKLLGDEHIDPAKLAAITALRDLKDSGLRLYGIFSLLTKFKFANCLDDRDRLFAFFGIANDVGGPRSITESHPGMVDCDVNYNIPACKVYLTFAKAALATIFPFDTIHCAGAFRSPKPTILGAGKSGLVVETEAVFPSWVPDWRLQAICRPLMKISSFAAGISKPRITPNVFVSGDNRTVRILGIQVTTVLSTNTEHAHQVLINLAALDNAECRGIPDGRTGIMTNLGLVGLAAHDVSPGDEVVIFFGARTPFVLRSVLSDDSGLPEYELIGDCYIDGMMFGERLREESSRVPIEFTIR